MFTGDKIQTCRGGHSRWNGECALLLHGFFVRALLAVRIGFAIIVSGEGEEVLPMEGNLRRKP